MNSNRKSSGFSYLILAALLVGIALLGIDLPAKAETLQAPDLHGSCVFAVQDWHNTEYLQAPGCFVTQGGGQSVKSIERGRKQASLIPPTNVVVDVPPVIDNGGETIPDTSTPAIIGGCKHPNVNRNGKLTCAKSPDDNSGQQTTTDHSNKNDKAEEKAKKNK